MLIDNKYEFGQIVYLKTDPDQHPRMVFCFEVSKGDILYKVCQGTNVSTHYDFELSEEKDVLKTLCA